MLLSPLTLLLGLIGCGLVQARSVTDESRDVSTGSSAEDCKDVYCEPGPLLGCEAVHEPGDCCPFVWICDENSREKRSLPTSGKCNCPWRFFQHYEVKGCKPVYENSSCCPIRFECPDVLNIDQSVCHYDGKILKIGEQTEKACVPCTCLEGDENPSIAKLVCAADGCAFSMIEDPRLKDGRCYQVYENGSCCPTGVKCDDENTDFSEKITCVVDGKIYHDGQQIHPEGMPCTECFCNANWTGVHGSSCRQINCNLLNDVDMLQKGCLPIYHEGTCCPIEWHCKTGEEIVIPAINLSGDYDDPEGKNKCKFDGKKYNIASVLEINHPTHCVSCPCLAPPDFTCIHRRCPPPPNNDWVNCQATYIEGDCCPKYECVQATPSSVCDPVKCPEACVEIVYADGCPICQCQDLLCAPPKCPADCALEYDPSFGSCPTCQCSGYDPSDVPRCAPVKCGPQCHEAISPHGCPMCVCGSLCSPPKCDPGCHVETFVLEGQCPGCVCSNISVTTDSTDEVTKIMCAPVKCSSYCMEVTGPNGCPMCDCGPLCSPPKCDPGCRLEAIPSSGPCPGCVCDKVPKIIQCAPVNCTGHCREVRVPNGCPLCMCEDLLCLPPECPPGCDINRDVAPGSCPDCLCPPTIPIERPICDPVKCSPRCREAISPQGCPVCICSPLCSPPKCDPGCQLQKDIPEGQCPGCECPKDDTTPSKDFRVRCGIVKCPEMCIEARGENGCPTCVCDYLCSPPKCGYGCRLQHTTPNSPCPECICDAVSEVNKIACSPPKCDEPGCRIDYTAQPCPACVCDGGVPEIACSPPKCDLPGCQIDYTSKPCPQCVCLTGQIPGVACSLPKCFEPGCHIDYSKQPCPECVCDSDKYNDFETPPIRCSPPKCDEPGCRIDFTTQPCPSCTCSGPQVPDVACSPPVCTTPGCHIDYSRKPCPECVCGIGGTRLGFLPIPCSPPKCDDPGCRIDYTTRPCPSCTCDHEISIPCSPPKCDDPGCRIDYTTRPCPSCTCDQEIPIPCSPPKCDDPGCRIDYTTRPCPSCVCDQVFPIQCSPPKCDDPGCRIDYSTKPCPSCNCDGRMPIPCSPPKCDDPGCRIDYTTYPCPSCVCDRGLQFPCSPPKCNEPGCRLNYTAYPCPECVCDAPKISCSMPKCDGSKCRIYYRPNECPQCVCDSGGYTPFVSCSMPKCDDGCKIDYNSLPCPSCDCRGRSARQIRCTPPRCPHGCRIDYSSKPCPSCACNNPQRPKIRCSMPTCGSNCEIDYDVLPCPTCKCDHSERPKIRCSLPRCGPSCEIDYDALPCPACKCDTPKRPKIACSMPRCGPSCVIDYNSGPCPSCKCELPQNDGVACSPPACDPGCWVDSSMVPCPGCKCRGGRRQHWHSGR